MLCSCTSLLIFKVLFVWDDGEDSVTLSVDNSLSAGYWSELGRLRSASCSGVISLLLYFAFSISRLPNLNSMRAYRPSSRSSTASASKSYLS